MRSVVLSFHVFFFFRFSNVCNQEKYTKYIKHVTCCSKCISRQQAASGTLCHATDSQIFDFNTKRPCRCFSRGSSIYMHLLHSGEATDLMLTLSALIVGFVGAVGTPDWCDWVPLSSQPSVSQCSSAKALESKMPWKVISQELEP